LMQFSTTTNVMVLSRYSNYPRPCGKWFMHGFRVKCNLLKYTV
jgi:hypothetical protein